MGLSDHPHASVGAGERLVLYVSSPHGEGAVQGTYNQHGNKAMSYTEGWPPKMVTMVPRIRTTLSFGLKTVLTCFCLIALLQLLQMVILLEYSPSNKLGDISLLLPLSTYGLANPWVDGDGSQRQQFMIPRLIHQTYRDERLPVKLLPLLESWTQRNRGWQRRFYTDEDCTRFVQDEFPQYYRAYRALPKDVERADFFRYMIILRHGGVYADIDVESRRPLESYILPTDSMVVGWEAEAPNDVEAFNHHYVRKRQVLQWFFAAAAGHPVLKAMCDHIANNMLTTFSNNTNIDTLERTGPGPWTDLVLRHSLQETPGEHTQWPVRILPRIAFGAHPAGKDGLNKASPQVAVFHHFWGSWKHKGGWRQRRTVLQLLYIGYLKAHCALLPSACGRPQQKAAPKAEASPSSGSSKQGLQALYPVSTAFNPPFTIMTNLVGEGDTQYGYDISAAITSWGFWQVSKGVPSPPLVVDALIGALNLSTKHTLVDIGSGLGYFSLAAAARGFKAIAFEASPRSLQPIVASIRYNGFQDRIRLYNVSLGARPEGICTAAVDPTAMPPAVSAADLGSSAGGLLHWRKHRQPLGGNFGDGVEREVRYDTEAMRGYSSPDLHALPQSACTRYTSRETLDRMLRVALSEDGLGGAGPGGQSGSQGSSQGSPSSSSSGWGGGVGALRLSANGWEGWVLDGAARLMIESPPGVVLLEYSPLLVSASGYAEPSLILYKLLTLGYKSAAHSGTACEKRLSMLPADPQRSAAASHSTKSPAKPTWCKLTPDVFDFVTRHLYTQRTPENIIFIHEASVPLMDAGAAAVSAAAAADSTQGRSGSTTSSTGSTTTTTTTTTSSSTTGGSGSSVSDTSAVGAVSTGGRAGHGAQGSTASHGLSLASQHSSGNIGLAANSRGSISKAAVGNAGASINKHVLLAQHAAVGGTLHSQQQHEPVSSSKRVRLQHQLSTA